MIGKDPIPLNFFRPVLIFKYSLDFWNYGNVYVLKRRIASTASMFRIIVYYSVRFRQPLLSLCCLVPHRESLGT